MRMRHRDVIGSLTFASRVWMRLIIDLHDWHRTNGQEIERNTMWLWLIFTGALCLLLGIVLTLIVQRRMPLYDADKLLAKLNSTVDCPLMDDRQPVAVQLPEVNS